MAGINDYTLDVILKAKEEGMAAFAAMNARLAEMVVATEAANAAMERMNSRGAEHSRMLRNIEQDTSQSVLATVRMADALESKLTPALNRSSGASNNASSGIMRFVQGAIPGGQTAGNIAIGVAAAAAALAPFTAELAASLILLGAWVVGATAFLAVLAVAAGGVLLLGGAIAALGIAAAGGLDPMANLEKANKALATATNQTEAAQEAVRLAQLRYDAKPTAVNLQILRDATEQLAENQQKQVQAQNAVNTATTQANGPISVLHEKIVALGEALGQQALPMVNAFATLMISLLPVVEPIANQLMGWFGDRLPLIMDQATTAFFGFIGVAKTLGDAWGKVIDEVLGHPFEYNKIFGTFVDMAVRGIVGLLQNLVALSNWFIERFPVLQSNANSFFGNFGLVIQAVGRALGAFVDWIIAHWPAINAAFDATWNAIQTGWGVAAPLFGNLRNALAALAPLFKYVQDNAQNLLPIYVALGAVLAALVLLIAAVGVALLLMVVAIVFVATKLTDFVNLVKARSPEMGAQFSALGAAVQTMGHDFGGVFFVIGQLLSNFGTAVHKEAVEGGAQFSALGTAAQTMQRDFGNVFSAIGTFLHQVGINIQVMVSQGGAQFSALGTAAQTMQRDIGAAFSAIGSAANAMAGAVGSAFFRLGGSISGGLGGVKSVIDRFDSAVTNVFGGFGVKIGPLPFATGGTVPGYAPGQDSVLAMLSPGEGVLTPQAVQGLGGPGAIDQLNQLGAGIASAALGTWGGQCVPFVEKMLGVFWPVAMASQLTRYMNSQTAKPGEAAVFTGGLFGHVALVTGPGDGYSFPVIDSNWVANETIGQHVMNKGMYGFAGFIDTGAKLGTLTGIPGLSIPIDLLNGLVDKALVGLGGWSLPLAKGILGGAVTGIKHSLGFDAGGQLPPGPSLVYNNTGRSENVTPGDTMDKVVDLLGQVVQEMRVLNGKGRVVNGMVAAGQFG